MIFAVSFEFYMIVSVSIFSLWMDTDFQLFSDDLNKAYRSESNIQSISDFLKSQGLNADEIGELLPSLRKELEHSTNGLDNQMYNNSGNDDELNHYIQDAWKIFSKEEAKTTNPRSSEPKWTISFSDIKKKLKWEKWTEGIPKLLNIRKRIGLNNTYPAESSCENYQFVVISNLGKSREHSMQLNQLSESK